MKASPPLVIFVVVVLSAAWASAQTNPLVGMWKQNMTKSTYSPGPPPKANMTKWEATGAEAFKFTTDGTDAQGRPTHTEFAGKFDGQDYPYKGSQTADMRSYRKVDDYTYEYVEKKGGKVVTTSKIAIARDGKTRTNTTAGTNAQGQKINNVAFYERQ